MAENRSHGVQERISHYTRKQLAYLAMFGLLAGWLGLGGAASLTAALTGRWTNASGNWRNNKVDNIFLEILFFSGLTLSFLMIVESAGMGAAGRWLLKQIKRAYHAVF